MSDDLVKRLRKWDYGESTWGLLEDAANRIAKLEAALREIAEMGYWDDDSTRIARKALDAE
jgi:hypothetical protein